jgi:hypothetical protein
LAAIAIHLVVWHVGDHAATSATPDSDVRRRDRDDAYSLYVAANDGVVDWTFAQADDASASVDTGARPEPPAVAPVPGHGRRHLRAWAAGR